MPRPILVLLLCFSLTAWSEETEASNEPAVTTTVTEVASSEAAPAAPTDTTPAAESPAAPTAAPVTEPSIDAAEPVTVTASEPLESEPDAAPVTDAIAPTEISPPAESAPAAKEPPEVVTAEVDWLAELMNGGNTAIALGILFLAMIAFTVERLIRLRAASIAPAGLVDAVLPLWHRGEFDQIHDRCTSQPSTLANMTAYLVEHRHADPELLIPGAGDIAVRELKQHNQKAFSLAVVAALAPLLGLLGTMIGMIESFKLVEQYGDEGGASMLAGSISKALITTAVGLIIAIPALGLYHFFKFRVSAIGNELDIQLERLVNAWLLKPNGEYVHRDADADSEAAAAAPAAVQG